MYQVKSPATGDEAIESELAHSSVAPRVTPADIIGNIASEHYFTAADGVLGTIPMTAEFGVPVAQIPPALGLLTFCVLVLKNGYTVTGESACVSPENYRQDVGRKIARENAVNKIWPLMGYELKQRLAMSSYDGDKTSQG